MGLFRPNIQKMLEQKDIPGLIKALADGRTEVQVAAVNALVQIGEQALGDLIAMLNQESPERFRVIPVLAKMVVQMQQNEPREQALNAVCSALKDGDASIRLTAALTLKEISSQITAPELLNEIRSALTDALSDSNPKVCQVIVEALGQFGESAGQSLVMAALLMDHPNARRLAVETLGSMHYAQAVEPLISALGGREGEERLLIIKALGQIGDARAVRPLLNAVEAAQKEVLMGTLSFGASETSQQSFQRIQMVHKVENAVSDALEEIGAPAVEQLVPALGSQNKWVQQTAAQLLRKMVDARAVEHLLPALQDGNSWVRTMAASLLGQTGDARAAKPLEALLKDADESVRNTAADALTRIKAI